MLGLVALDHLVGLVEHSVDAVVLLLGISQVFVLLHAVVGVVLVSEEVAVELVGVLVLGVHSESFPGNFESMVNVDLVEGLVNGLVLLALHLLSAESHVVIVGTLVLPVGVFDAVHYYLIS